MAGTFFPPSIATAAPHRLFRSDIFVPELPPHLWSEGGRLHNVHRDLPPWIDRHLSIFVVIQWRIIQVFVLADLLCQKLFNLFHFLQYFFFFRWNLSSLLPRLFKNGGIMLWNRKCETPERMWLADQSVLRAANGWRTFCGIVKHFGGLIYVLRNCARGLQLRLCCLRFYVKSEYKWPFTRVVIRPICVKHYIQLSDIFAQGNYITLVWIITTLAFVGGQHIYVTTHSINYQ